VSLHVNTYVCHQSSFIHGRVMFLESICSAGCFSWCQFHFVLFMHGVAWRMFTWCEVTCWWDTWMRRTWEAWVTCRLVLYLLMLLQLGFLSLFYHFVEWYNEFQFYFGCAKPVFCMRMGLASLWLSLSVVCCGSAEEEFMHENVRMFVAIIEREGLLYWCCGAAACVLMGITYFFWCLS